MRILSVIFPLLLTACTIYHAVPVPGETRQDQKGKIIAAWEAFSNARVAAKHTKQLHCPINEKNYKVLDTKFLGYSTEAERKKMKISTDDPAWTEDWIIEACGTKWRVPIFFYGDIISTGGAYPLK